jgi:integrase
MATYITCDPWFNKPFSEITREDCRNIIKKLINDDFRRRNTLINCKNAGGKYSETTKKTYVKHLKQLSRWIYLESKNKPQFDENGRQLTFDQIFSCFTYQMDQDKIKEPEIISLHQAELISDTSNLKLGTLIMVGFDTGFRPEELWNIRIKDVQWDSDKKKYWIYCQFPKKNSKKRVIDVPLCTKWLNKYLAINRDKKNGELDEPLFKVAYKYAGKYLKNKCKELFGFRIDMYTLRHSSIQYYLEIYKRDFIALADRYGWSYGTVGKRLMDYLARSKVRLPDASELVRKDRVDELKGENDKLKAKLDSIEQRLDRKNDEHGKDIYDCAVRLLTEMGIMKLDQNLVFKKLIGPFIKDNLNYKYIKSAEG